VRPIDDAEILSLARLSCEGTATDALIRATCIVALGIGNRVTRDDIDDAKKRLQLTIEKRRAAARRRSA
jgi:hypothetical protein